jgi:hypothetical protein
MAKKSVMPQMAGPDVSMIPKKGKGIRRAKKVKGFKGFAGKKKMPIAPEG